jgi:hypothetical protein
VIGFDVQEEAIRATRNRLKSAGISDTVTLHQQGHEAMADAVPAEWRGSVGAVMFNLGYLPGSDKSCITEPGTTVQALKASLSMLRSGGVCTVVIYTGHEGGAEEAEAVQQWAEALDPDTFTVVSYRFVNRDNPPRLVLVERS